MDLASDQHDECEALLFVIVLQHEIIEVRPILDELIKSLDPPAPFVFAEDRLAFLFAAGLYDIDTKVIFGLLKTFRCVACLSKFDTMLVVIAAFFVLINVAEDIDFVPVRALFHPELYAGMFPSG